MPARTQSVFQDDLDRQLEDPEFRRHFALERNRIETVDRVMNHIIDALENSGLTRADVARAIGSHSSAVRRLLNQASGPVNPTLQTLSDVAAVLSFEVELVPMTRERRLDVSDQLTGRGNRTAGVVGPGARRKRSAPAA